MATDVVETVAGIPASSTNSFATMQDDDGNQAAASSSTDVFTLSKSSNGSMDAITINPSNDTATLSARVGTPRRPRMWIDFTVVVSGSGDFNPTITQVGGTVALTNTLSETDGRIGVAKYTATGNTMNSCIRSTSAIFLGIGECIFEADIKIGQAGDVSDPHAIYVGLNSGTSIAANNQRIVFKHLYSENSGKWTCQVQTADANQEVTNTNVAMTPGDWYSLKIVVNAGRTEIKFYIGGTLVATHSNTSFMPTTTTMMFASKHVTKTAHSTNTTSFIDFIDFIENYTGGVRPV